MYMKKLLTLFLALAACVGMNAEKLYFTLSESALPSGTPDEIEAYGSFGSQTLVHAGIYWYTDAESIDDLVNATENDTFGFRYSTKVLGEQIKGVWVPVVRRVGDYWTEAGSMKQISFDSGTTSVWDASTFVWIDTPEGIQNTAVTPKTVKLIHNGQVLILRGNYTYTLTGQELK